MRRTITQGIADAWDLLLAGLYYAVIGFGYLTFGAFCVWFIGAMAGARTDEVDALLGWVAVLAAVFGAAIMLTALCLAVDWAVKRLATARQPG